MADSSTKKHETRTVTQAAAPQGAQAAKPRHQCVLTQEQYALLLTLAEQHASSDRVRADMASLLTDAETLAALQNYADFFAFGGVNVGPAIEALPRAIKLQQLKRQLDLASELVQRHIVATSEPVVAVVSDVRRMVMATPEGSAVRDAFTVLDGRWRETFRGGRTAARDEAVDEAAKGEKTPR